MNKLVLHLVSDSSGQTVKYITNTALRKFSNLDVKKYYWPLIRNSFSIKSIFKKIEKKRGIVIFTILNQELCNELLNFCTQIQIPCVSVIDHLVNTISSHVDISVDVGIKHELDKGYFKKIVAISFTLKHDDGQNIKDLGDSDIILVGPSRTSKTPTSVYLSYNGFKTSNIPFVYGYQLPKKLFSLVNPTIVGLVINPTRLVEIRKHRLDLLNVNKNMNYTDLDIITEEFQEINRLCITNHWKIIDVSERSIEETSALIIAEYYKQRQKY
ncbi:pyruvate, water dikinase regulatory protein [Rickettsia endosymbiont of Cardiosporidium cionae]|uniref:pyruvate, water dikinase regulatory protein n=1 Tax=Rickettsia endosymbiont of Cardiosporidium cionae TaxID=2777155 RepID=UPI00189611D1|nr:pyruvate, water dikinase regulatory protein [Rickettsia endosymbiont of Cardiosporidium cionae]KAF8818350.1 kinase/pyrophosphorylase [Rickettsia endosymbiont of Cardiosporidium cionae]